VTDSNRIDLIDGRMEQLDSFERRRQKESLPIFRVKKELLYLIQQNQVTLVCGETGSGKTTQLPQYLHEAEWTKLGCIACTQPRRLAATSVCSRVAEEMCCKVGTQVGYSIRFENMSTQDTLIKYMTDGMLVREALTDPMLSNYGVIMIDEAHERTQSTDLILGLVKKILAQRPQLRVIISSATLQAQEFVDFFGPEICKTIMVQGRLFPVDEYFLESPTNNYIARTVELVANIHSSKPLEEDILVFLTGRDEIEQTVQAIADHSAKIHPKLPKLMPLALYAGLSTESQYHIFEPSPENLRKVVVATNIAEASVTIEGIVHVIDCGYVKLRVYDPFTRIESLVKMPVSKAGAIQRKGRAGRTQKGACYRMFPQRQWDELPTSQPPELQRSALAPVLLQLKALGVNNILRFDFLSPPFREYLVEALEILYYLDAIDDHANLTPTGKKMAQLPLGIMTSKVLVSSGEYGCSLEVLTIAAMSSLDTVFLENTNDKMALAAAKRKFTVEEGDHLTYYNVYQAFVERRKQNQEGVVRWCRNNYLDFQSLTKVVSVRVQLARYLDRFGFPIQSSNGKTEPVLKCLVSGYFAHAAHIQGDGSYRVIQGNHLVWIHPNSVLFTRNAKWVVFQSMLETKEKVFMQGVTAVHPLWLPEVAPDYYKEEKR